MRLMELNEKNEPVLRMRPVTWQVSLLRTALTVIKQTPVSPLLSVRDGSPKSQSHRGGDHGIETQRANVGVFCYSLIS